jgi:hypothetical protein
MINRLQTNINTSIFLMKNKINFLTRNNNNYKLNIFIYSLTLIMSYKRQKYIMLLTLLINLVEIVLA